MRSMNEKITILNFRIEPKLLSRIDDFRFQQRFENRAEAIKWLLDWALTQKPKRSMEPKKK